MASRASDGATGRARATRPRKVGYAVVGLGHIAQTAVLPAFRNARGNSRLAALVSGDRRKREQLSREYGAPSYGYEALDECLARRDVDAVWICTPNELHAEHALRAARAGVHVLVEKPMAPSAAECEAMMRAARDHGVRLMVGYRLHFERASLEAADMVAAGGIGEPRFFSAEFSYQVARGNVRTRGAPGGGAIWDLGPYCVNAARSLFRSEPREVAAFEAGLGVDARFGDVAEAWSVLLRFPGDRLATFTCSFGAAATDRWRIAGTRGDIVLEPAFDYSVPLVRTATIGDRARRTTFPVRDQFGPELLYFSECVLEGREPEPSGEEGLADVRVLEAALESARTGRATKVRPVPRHRRPTARQVIERPALPPRASVDIAPPEAG